MEAVTRREWRRLEPIRVLDVPLGKKLRYGGIELTVPPPGWKILSSRTDIYTSHTLAIKMLLPQAGCGLDPSCRRCALVTQLTALAVTILHESIMMATTMTLMSLGWKLYRYRDQ